MFRNLLDWKKHLLSQLSWKWISNILWGELYNHANASIFPRWLVHVKTYNHSVLQRKDIDRSFREVKTLTKIIIIDNWILKHSREELRKKKKKGKECSGVRLNLCLTICKLSEDNILTSWVGLLCDIDNYHCQWRRNHIWPTSMKHNTRTAYLISLSISHIKDRIHHQVSNDTKLKGIVSTLSEGSPSRSYLKYFHVRRGQRSGACSAWLMSSFQYPWGITEKL